MTDFRTASTHRASARGVALSAPVVERQAGSTRHLFRPQIPRLLARLPKQLVCSPFASATLITWAFFAILYRVLKPGYWINDDLKMVWNIVGYPGDSQPIPFLIHSNVLLGFALDALYEIRVTPNWGMIGLAIINACSIWGLLYIVIQSRLSASYKWIGGTVVLAGLGAPTLNLTFTFTAALSSLSGICLLLIGVKQGARHWIRKEAAGTGLVLLGALIRLEMLGLVLVIVLPGAIFAVRSLNRRRLLMACGVASLLVAAGYAADKLYVRSFPEWHAFYAYDQARENLHDAHRLTNLHNQIHHVGWSGNDQELFAHWFFPDPRIYSFDHIEYLVQNTAGTSQDVSGTVGSFVAALAVPGTALYLIMTLAIGIWAIWGSGEPANTWTTFLPGLAALAANLILAWAYKNPRYVLVSTLAGSAACSAALLGVRAEDLVAGTAPLRDSRSSGRLARAGALCLVALCAAFLAGQTLDASRTNAAKQAAYGAILSDLSALQQSGKIAGDALIVSPAHGLPYEWSYPFMTSLPPVPYFDTGWITFSPTYERVLRDYGVKSLPEALYQDSRLYLMAESSFMGFLRTYYQEHGKTAVVFVPVYAMPNRLGLDGYDGIFLYKILLSP